MYKNIYSAKKLYTYIRYLIKVSTFHLKDRRPKKDMKIQTVNKNTTVIDILSFNDQAKQILLDSRDFR